MGTVISGHYSAGLQGGGLEVAALAQTATIPAESKALLFNAATSGFQVSLNGSLALLIKLGHTATGEFSGYDNSGLDVSALAGQEVELKFATLTFSSVILDDIRFSPTALVPEPSTYALFGLGLGLLVCSRRRHGIRRPRSGSGQPLSDSPFQK